MNTKILAPIAIILCLSLLLVVPSSSALNSEDYFKIRLVDDEGNDSPNVLAESYTIDTITTVSGTVFILKAHKTISASSVNLLIESNDGKFNSYVSVENLSSYLAESGVRVELSYGSQTYHADLKQNNSYKAYFENDAHSVATLDPGIKYHLTIRPLTDISSSIVPETISNVKFTFSAHMETGYHQVAFYSEGVLVQAYKLADGQTINVLPDPPARDGYEFLGWYLPNGQKLTAGYVITADDGDIIATAKWSSQDSQTPISFDWWIYLVIAGVAGGIFFIILKRRNKEEEEIL